MAFIVRLLSEARILRHANVKALARYTGQHIVTAKAMHLSKKSCTNKYYTIEDSTRASVKALLTDLLRRAG